MVSRESKQLFKFINTRGLEQKFRSSAQAVLYKTNFLEVQMHIQYVANITARSSSTYMKIAQQCRKGLQRRRKTKEQDLQKNVIT